MTKYLGPAAAAAAVLFAAPAHGQAGAFQRIAPAMELNLEMRDAWQQVDGCAKRIAIAEPGHPFVTGCGSSDDTAVFYLNNAGVFEPTGTSATAIASRPGPDGGGRVHWAIDNANHSSLGAPNCVKEIGTGISPTDKSVTWDWALTCPSNPADRDYPVARRVSNATLDNGAAALGVGRSFDPSFHPYPGAGVRLGVGLTDSLAWVINSAGELWRQNYCKGADPDESVQVTAFCKSVPDGWERIPGCARSIGNGGLNRVWVIGCDPDRKGNSSIWQYSGAQSGPIENRWLKRAGRGKEIAVDADGRPWVVRADGTIWRWIAPLPVKGARADSDPQEARAADPR